MKPNLTIEPHLQTRLAVLAEREGASFEEFAERILRSHAEHAERAIIEQAEDERRWQKYLETGASIPFDAMRKKVQNLAADAARKIEIE